MNYINSITEAIGKTPLMKLNKINHENYADIFVKLEHLNPSGSYKDRMALSMVEAAEQGLTWNGKKLPQDGIVVEASAGNTAPAVAMVCAAKGYKSRLVLYRYIFKKGQDARMLITRAFGPEVNESSEPEKYLSKEQIEKLSKDDPDLIDVLTGKMDCAMMEKDDPRCVWVDQIYNKYNFIGQKVLAHEIYDQLDGKIDAIGCSVGSGATLYGLSLGLKEKGVRPETIFGVVPKGSEVYVSLSKDECARDEFKYSSKEYEIASAMGLDKWVTEKSIVELMIEDGYPDLFFRVSSEEARDMANRLCQEEGIFCGMSSGANVAIALKIAERLGPGKNVVTTIVDRRDRYLLEHPNEKYAV
jgi:cysteine synthase A